MSDQPQTIVIDQPPEQTAALGRSHLNPQLTEIFCRLVSMGNYYRSCCAAVGIAYETFNLWMRYGRAAVSDEDPYRQFYLKVLEANARAELYAVKMWKGHFETDYRAIRDFLARRYPERWGSRHFVTMAVDREMEKLLGQLHSELSPDEYAKVLRVITGGSTAGDDEQIVDTLMDEDVAFNFEPAITEARVNDVSGTESST